MPNEPVATIVQRALEPYVNGTMQGQGEIKRFLESQPAFPKSANGQVRQQEVTRLLSRPIYAGYIRHENWGVNWVKGHHEPDLQKEFQGRSETH